MTYITGLDFTKDVGLFGHLQNGGKELMLRLIRRLMRSVRCPFVLVLTCDRAEVVSTSPVSCEVLERSLSVSPIAAAACRYALEGEEAERHLFLLSSGIISPLFGEDTVTGQLAQAGELGRLAGSASPYLNKLIGSAVAFGKASHARHAMRVFDRTIVDEMLSRLSGCRKILIAGSGEAARVLAQALVCSGHEVAMALRDETKTFLTPVGVRAVAFAQRVKEAAASDAVVSASSGLYHTFSRSEVSSLSSIPMYDLAFPYDLPDGSNVIRLVDLKVPTPERDELVRLVEKEAQEAYADFLAWAEREAKADDISFFSQEVASESLRRLSSTISSLALGEDAEMKLREAILDSVRKSCIAKSFHRS